MHLIDHWQCSIHLSQIYNLFLHLINSIFLLFHCFCYSVMISVSKEKLRTVFSCDCMFLLCQVRISEWIRTLLLPECQGTPCSKQIPYMSLSDCNGTWIHNHLVNKRTVNHLAKLSKMFICELIDCGCESRCSLLLLFRDKKLFCIITSF